MILIKQIKSQFIECLSSDYGNEEAEELFWLSLEHVLQLKRLQIKLKDSLSLSEKQESKLKQLLGELKTGKPIQYSIGEAWFFNQRFLVNEAVLIPRPETEELISFILEENKKKDLKVLDIGTGSGCIPITLKKYLNNGSEVYGIDISEDALKIAGDNARNLSCEVNFLKVDILKEEPMILSAGGKFDIIVSNPPYITPQEKLAMHKNVLEFEPHLALFVEENDPLIFYRAIANYASKNLNQQGKLYFEINQAFGNEIVELLSEKGFQDIQLKKDLSGHDRMVSALWPLC